MGTAVAGQAGRSLCVARLAGDRVNPQLISVDTLFVARGALLRDDFFGALNFVCPAVATRTSLRSQDGVRALGQLCDRLFVAGTTRWPAHRLGVRIFLYPNVASGTAQVAMDAALVLGRVDMQAPAGLGLHPSVPVASQALFVGRESG